MLPLRSTIALVAGLTTTLFTVSAEAQDLPSGDLQLFAGGADSARFLVLGEESRSGSIVEVPILTVYHPGIRRPAGTIVLEIARTKIDCAGRTWQDLFVRGFTEDGRLVEAIESSEPSAIEENDAFDFAARLYCDGVRIQMNPVRGYQAALALGRSRLGAP